VAGQISQYGGTAHYYSVDLSNSNSIEHIAQTIKTEIGIPNIIINNAGTGKWLFTEETSFEDAESMIALPYFAAFNIVKSFLPDLLKRQSGHIVNITSGAAYRAIPGAAAYNTACWAIRGFTESLRGDLSGTGIKVTLMISGTSSTPGYSHYPGVEERMPKILNIVPTLTPEKVAQAMIHGIRQEQKVIITPWLLKVLIGINHLLPWFVEWLVIKTGWKHTTKK